MRNLLVIILVFSVALTPIVILNLASYLSCTPGCDNSVKTLTISSATLFAGSPSSANHQGTSKLEVVFNNPGSQTEIISMFVTTPSNSSVTIYQCQSAVSCGALTDVELSAGTNAYFNTPSTIFYLSSNIVQGEAYNYDFNFANGQSVFGSLVAQ
jgi:hypothetical protein